MVNPNRFYTYAYLREDRTPYYIGKGTCRRVYDKKKNEINPPKDKSRIIFLKKNLTDEEAFKHEIYMIAVFGRIDLGTGILRNKTDGGDGAFGMSEETKRKISETKRKVGHKPMLGKKMSDESRKKLSQSRKGIIFTQEHKDNMAKAFSKRYKITFNDGREVFIENMKKFCRETQYHSSGLRGVMKGEYKKHKDIVAVERLDASS